MAVILKGLGYKVERLSVASQDGAGAAKPEAAPAQTTGEAASPEVSAERLPADAVCSDRHAGQSVEGESNSMLEIWTPARTGGRSRGRGKRDRQAVAEGDKAPRKGRSNAGHRQSRTPRPGPTGPAAQVERSPRQPTARPLDPDSPFAKLAALKADLEKTSE